MTLNPSEPDRNGHAAIWLRAVLAELPLGGAILELESGYRQRAMHRASDLFEELASRVDERLLQDRVVQSEELESALWRSIRMAADSTLEAKRRRLGAVLGDAMLDRISIDEALLQLDLLSQVEAHHVVCLEAVRRTELAELARGNIAPTARGSEQEFNDAVNAVAERFPRYVVQRLTSQGLLNGSVSWDGVVRVTGTTVVGQQLLDDLGSTNAVAPAP